jgi:hypothetical protein
MDVNWNVEKINIINKGLIFMMLVIYNTLFMES